MIRRGGGEGVLALVRIPLPLHPRRQRVTESWLSETGPPRGCRVAPAGGPPRRVCRVRALLRDLGRGGESAPFLGLLLWPPGVFPDGRGRSFSSLHGCARSSQNNLTIDHVALRGVIVAIGSHAPGRVLRSRVRNRFSIMVRPHDFAFSKRRGAYLSSITWRVVPSESEERRPCLSLWRWAAPSPRPFGFERAVARAASRGPVHGADILQSVVQYLALQGVKRRGNDGV